MFVLDFNEIIHIILIVQSLFFSIQLLTYKDSQLKSGRIIGGMMVVLFLYYIVTFFSLAEINKLKTYTSFLIIPLLLAYPPFYFIYVKSITTPFFKLRIGHIKHFIPSLIYLIINIIFFILPLNYNLSLNNFDNIHLSITLFMISFVISMLVYLVQIIGYSAMTIILLRKHSKNINNYFSYEQNISLTWLKIIIFIIVLTASIEVIMMFTMFGHLKHYMETVSYIFLLLSINFWGYFAIKQKDIYHKEENNAVLHDIDNINTNLVFDESTIEKEQNVIDEEDQKQIVADILKLMEQEKPFLDPHLTIHDLAIKLGTNKTYVSIAINNILKKNFKILVNEYRINEAIRMFNDERYDNISTEGIGFSVGYISKSTFTNYFKSFTGKTPAVCRKDMSKRN